MKIFLQTITFFVFAVSAFKADAQSLDFSEHNGTAPIEVTSEEGIEWQQNEKKLVAYGKAVAKRGDVRLDADRLTAFYSKNDKGDNRIHLLEAEGGVVISSPKEKATGNNVTYDINKAIMVLKGVPAKLKTAEEQVTAYGSLEYWQKEKKAVARKNATVIKDGYKLNGDVISAFFREKKGGGNELKKVEAFGNVEIITKRERVTGSKGIYTPDTGIINISGPVMISQGENALSGDFAEVNLKTGVSRLLASPDSKEKGRVKGVFLPKSKIKNKKGKED